MSQGRHWTERLPGGRRRHAPAWLWLETTLANVALWLLADLALGPWGAGIESPERYWLRRIVLAMLFGWIVATSRWAFDGARRDLDALRPLLRLPASEFEALCGGLRAADPLRRRACALLGGAIGPLIPPLSQGDPVAFLRAYWWDYSLLLGMALNAVMFALLGLAAWNTLVETRTYARAEAAIGEIDLLDPDLLEPFARRGLRSATFWIGGSALGSLVFLSEGLEAPIVLVVLATIAVGVATLVFPMRGAHRRILAEKRAELARARAAIRAEREKLLDASFARNGGRLADLVAYESRIERVREWPLDLPTALRFSGLLVLASGSWLGGAVAERVLAWLW